MNISKVRQYFFQEMVNLLYEFRACTTDIPSCVDYDVPYVCQFASAESVERVLSDHSLAEKDPKWSDTGAASPESYAKWAFAMCGMASTAMAIAFFQKKRIPIIELAESARKRGVYQEEEHTFSPMRYREFSEWIVRYGLKAGIRTRLSMAGIRYALSQGSLVIASVNPNIRGYATAPEDRIGGHLVLVRGFDTYEKVFFINNPSGCRSTNTQKRHRISEKVFSKYFAGRGLVLSRNDS
ncbi:MAG: C39 family peptidase [Candidatus Moraniibacteriota bacterium]